MIVVLQFTTITTTATFITTTTYCCYWQELMSHQQHMFYLGIYLPIFDLKYISFKSALKFIGQISLWELLESSNIQFLARKFRYVLFCFRSKIDFNMLQNPPFYAQDRYATQNINIINIYVTESIISRSVCA